MIAPASSAVTSATFMLPMAGSIRRLHIQTLSAAVRGLLLTAITSLA